jgi:hypothetical protein
LFQQQQQQQPQFSGWSMFKTILVRIFIMYVISSFFQRSFQPQQQQAGAGSSTPSMGALNLLAKDPLMVRVEDFETY